MYGWRKRNAPPPWFRLVSRLLVIHKLIKAIENPPTPKVGNGGARVSFAPPVHTITVVLILFFGVAKSTILEIKLEKEVGHGVGPSQGITTHGVPVVASQQNQFGYNYR